MDNFDNVVKITSKQELIERPRFIEKLIIENEESAKKKLRKIIGYYKNLNPEINCGLSNCSASHANGYLVELDDGKETNIGHICGEGYFGADFKSQMNLMEALIVDKEYFERIEEFFSQRNAYKAEYDTLIMPQDKIGFFKIKRGIIELTSTSEIITNWIRQDIRRFIASNGDITNVVKKTSEEMDTERVMRSDALTEVYIPIDPYKEVLIAHVNEFSILTKLDSLLKLHDFFESFFKNLKPAIETTKDSRRKIIKGINDYQRNFYDLKALCNQGNLFFRTENLLKIELAIKKPSDKEQFIKWVNKYSNS